MPFRHQLQRCRYEMKYIVGERRARAVRDLVRSYLELDEHTDPNRLHGYEIHNLYLDSPTLVLCRASMEGHGKRFKLRIRAYDDKPTSPLFFEIKSRSNDVIFKERAAVNRAAAERLLVGVVPSRSDLYEGRSDSLPALRRFYELQQRIGAREQVRVSYMREAYVSPGSNDLRVTFDRAVVARKHPNSMAFWPDERRFHRPITGVILELKFTDRLPVWMCEMVRMFDLQRLSMAKYVAGVEAVMDGQPYREYRHREVWV